MTKVSYFYLASSSPCQHLYTISISTNQFWGPFILSFSLYLVLVKIFRISRFLLLANLLVIWPDLPISENRHLFSFFCFGFCFDRCYRIQIFETRSSFLKRRQHLKHSGRFRSRTECFCKETLKLRKKTMMTLPTRAFRLLAFEPCCFLFQHPDGLTKPVFKLRHKALRR